MSSNAYAVQWQPPHLRPSLFTDMAKYNYDDYAAKANEKPDRTTATTSSMDTAAPLPAAEANTVVITLNSEDRDEKSYPSPATCHLPLPETLSAVTKVTMRAAEFPDSEYSLTSPKLFFSEYHDTKYVPFCATIATGTYTVAQLAEALSSSLSSAVPLTEEFAAVRNTYVATYSEAWTRMCITSNMVAPFTLQFRSDVVTVTSATLQNSYIVATIYDAKTTVPFSRGAGVTFTPGAGIAPLACVVDTVDSSGTGRVYLRIVPTIDSLTYIDTIDSITSAPSQRGIVPAYKTALTTFGKTNGDITISSTASLTPFSANTTSESTNLGDILGFGTVIDRDPQGDTQLAGDGSSTVLSMQSPFGALDGTLVITTALPHFCSVGDFVNVFYSQTLLDSLNMAVAEVLDDTHIVVVPDVTYFLSQMPPLIRYDPNGQSYFFDYIGSVGPPTIVSSGVFTVTVQAKSGITIDQLNFGLVGQNLLFAADPAYNAGYLKPEWMYASVTADSADTGATGPELNLTITYPSWLVNANAATLTRVADGTTGLDLSKTYYPRCVMSPSKYDFGIGHRYIYIELTLDNNAVGNMHLASLPGKKLFARVPLTAGTDMVTFIAKNVAEGAITLSTPFATVRNIGFNVYNPNGQLYNIQGINWSITLAFECESPLQ